MYDTTIVDMYTPEIAIGKTVCVSPTYHINESIEYVALMDEFFNFSQVYILYFTSGHRCCVNIPSSV